MIEYFNTHMHAFWFATGFILLATELLVLGFATGFVLFLGLAALATGGLLWAEIIPLTWLSSIATFSLSSIVISASLWKPFKSLEKNRKPKTKDNSSDIIGHRFRLENDISFKRPGATRYSGIEWKVEIEENDDIDRIVSGTLVSVVSVDAGKFRVMPVVDESDD